MWRLVLFLIGVLGVAFGLAKLADNPGSLLIDWGGYKIETSVFHAVVILAFISAALAFAWSIIHQIWTSPAAVSHIMMKRRQRRGLDALSSGMIAIGAGDRTTATRYAIQARKSLPNEPLTHLLRAQAAQLSGDKATARRIFEAMLAAPDTEQLGLRGLFLEASREGETEAARQFAERAIKLNSKLTWPAEALFDLQCKAGDWAGALETLATEKRNGQLEKPVADRRRALLLTAQAMALEDNESDRALTLALEAHGLAPALIPASAVAGRLLASRGNTSRAAKVIQKTWAKAPHPDLAAAYAYARTGDSTRDRMDRIKQLAALNPNDIESPLAVARTAVEARFYDEARTVLAPLLEDRLTRRVAMLMARIEGEQNGDRGRMREWLVRSANAAPDRAWTADGVVSESWAPTSPVTGALDAFQWRIPVSEPDSEAVRVEDQLESWIALSGPASEGGPARPTKAQRGTPTERNGIVDTEALEPSPASWTTVAIHTGRAKREPSEGQAASPAQHNKRLHDGTTRPSAPVPAGTDASIPRAPDDPGLDFDTDLDDGLFEPDPMRKTGSDD
jgi:HemY protein